MEKILTIVIPTYNMQDYLRRCLDSLIVADDLMNTYEVLVINDGSKDSSSVIGHEYQDRYPATFRVIDKGNENYGSCINRGLAEAKGRYIKVLDADDWFDNIQFALYLEYLVNLEREVDMILTPYTKRYANDAPAESVTPKNVQYNYVYCFHTFDFDITRRADNKNFPFRLQLVDLRQFLIIHYVTVLQGFDELREFFVNEFGQPC